MKSGYKVEWTDNALAELKAVYTYLENNWTVKELQNLSIEIEHTVKLISENHKLFPISDKLKIRKVVIKKLNTLYYREMRENRIEVLSFFLNKQNPNKRKI